jgi:hypothetical protein
MRHFLTNSLAASLSFIALGALAQAQFGPHGGPYQPDSVSALIDHVHEDLNHGYSVWHLSRRDRDRLNHAESQLRNFSAEWRKGKFDKGNLDDAIGDTQHILDRNHLSGAERDALWSDVEQLRKMREAYDRHEIGRW